ncbi:MAG: peptidyl-prolyl cis-trans isomerase [Deltaproteobacteria bacterium]|nr:peptidyl-prolyl cis-trans isomerase [Deltaproteobacteria bacterium]MBW2154645.1 peptidyl-prolyl cis-trans isomerase [Deltaproteobacteria bacterium]
MALFMLSINIFGCGSKEHSPNPDIVATFQGGQITRKQVEDYIKKRIPELDTDAKKQIRRKEIYKHIVKNMVLDLMIEKKIKENKLDKRKNIKHIMKHISEQMNINQLHAQAHGEKIKVSEEDIRKYYEDNRDQFPDDLLVEVKEEIRNILQAKREKEYFRNYIKELKKKAVITRNDHLLKVPQPAEADMRIYYEKNRNIFGSPEKPFPEVKDQIMKSVRKEIEKKWFEQNGNSTLFTIHGKRYTLGEFYQELQELPVDEREKYKTYEDLKRLVDLMIERLLVVEDTYDRMLNVENKDEIEHVREDILRQILHQEEIDDKVSVSDEEIKTYYEANKDKFFEPPRVKISYIRIGRGQTEDEKKRTKKRVEEAYGKLKPGFLKKAQPFEEVAREYSEDPETAKKGGAIDGWISESSDLLEEIAAHILHENVLPLSAGEISDPFYFHGSWYIVKGASAISCRKINNKSEADLLSSCNLLI